MIGTTNTQGRYINGEATPCTDAASAATGRFIHLEQERTKLRADATGWAKVSTALENLVSCVLPVELNSFNAILKENQVLLNWQTASEINNHGFEIERSFDGKNWKNIGFVQGNRTTTDLFNYSFNDKKPLVGVNYYRLKQLDFDGKFEYSKTIAIELSMKKDELRIFPNPIRDELNIANGEGQAMIYNMLGQQLRAFSITNAQFLINLSDLAEGQYMLHIQKEDGRVIVKRFVK